MTHYELFQAISEMDEKLLLRPRRWVSLRMNVVFCFLAANVSGLVPKHQPAVGLIVFALAFAAMYGAATWLMNRKRKRFLVGEEELLLSAVHHENIPHSQNTSRTH